MKLERRGGEVKVACYQIIVVGFFSFFLSFFLLFRRLVGMSLGMDGWSADGKCVGLQGACLGFGG